MSYLILVRHGRSDWNDKGMWQGISDFSVLTERGKMEAEIAAKAISNIKIGNIFCSKLTRIRQTVEIMVKKLHLEKVPIVEDSALNERDYGIYTGKNKWEIKDQVGDEEFAKIRRVWDHNIPGGETLKMVYDRVIPYYSQKIQPLLKSGRNVLIVSSGNSLRSLVKYLENIPDDKIAECEINTGEAYVYDIDLNGNIISKEIRAVNLEKV